MSPFVMDLPPAPLPAMVVPATSSAAARGEEPAGEHTLLSSAFGTLMVPEGAMMHFVAPLWGFPDHDTFALLPAAREGLWWLLSANDPALTFLLADPFVTDPSYALDISDSDERTLGLESPTEALALVLVAFPSSADEGITANFRAPIIFNLAERTVLQVVSRNDSHDLRHPMELAAYPLQEGGLSLD
jgi:flagellar assembly factor FliW